MEEARSAMLRRFGLRAGRRREEEVILSLLVLLVGDWLLKGEELEEEEGLTSIRLFSALDGPGYPPKAEENLC